MFHVVIGRAKRAPHCGVQSRFREIGERASEADFSTIAGADLRGDLGGLKKFFTQKIYK